jgi:hypothetical protein
METLYTKNEDGSLTCSIEFTADEVRQIALRYPNPQAWVDRILDKEMTRLERQVLTNWTKTLMEDKTVESIPTDKAQFLTLVESKANPVVEEEEEEPGLEDSDA